MERAASENGWRDQWRLPQTMHLGASIYAALLDAIVTAEGYLTLAILKQRMYGAATVPYAA